MRGKEGLEQDGKERYMQRDERKVESGVIIRNYDRHVEQNVNKISGCTFMLITFSILITHITLSSTCHSFLPSFLARVFLPPLSNFFPRRLVLLSYNGN